MKRGARLEDWWTFFKLAAIVGSLFGRYTSHLMARSSGTRDGFATDANTGSRRNESSSLTSKAAFGGWEFTMREESVPN